MIQWKSEKTEILLNPRLPNDDASELIKQLQSFDLSSHIWLTTSGTTGKYKCVALSKEALFVSAHSVNQSYHITNRDVWVLALPEFHVGGIGVRARAYLSGSKVVKVMHWSPHEFHRCVEEESATVSALVPPQMYDIAAHQFQAPSNYRFTFIGGGAMTRALFEKSSELGWNPICTYGMTESSSQIASANTKIFDGYTPLSHVSLRIESDQRIAIKSEALLTGYAIPSKEKTTWIDPKINGWYITDDLGAIHEGKLSIFGRGVDSIKINGELVNVGHLRTIIEECRQSIKLSNCVGIIPVPHERSGYQIHLVVEGGTIDVTRLLHAYNQQVMPYEKIQKVHYVEQFPRSPLGKVLISELKAG